MRKKIFHSFVLVSVIVILLSSVISTSYLYNYFNQEEMDKIHTELQLVSEAVNELGVSYLDSIEDDTLRFTVIDEDGVVIYDTIADVGALENHGDREEVQEAFESGEGSSIRYSSTLTENTYYEAILLNDGTVLRVSVSQLALTGAFLQILPVILVIVVLAISLSMLISHHLANKITEPLLTLDLDNPIENDTYEELAPVLTKIYQQHQQLSQQMQELKQKNDEFAQIMSSMSEGLIILDEKGLIIMMNDSAREIFKVQGDVIGTDFLIIDRSVEFTRAITETANQAYSEITLNKNGREYQFTINRIESDNNFIGTLILGFDITEKAYAERNRQEFTANVSHELKTPLQSIIGISKMIESGIVKSEDITHFAGNIYKEATRLYNLIEDIIQLSQLDEKADYDFEPVDLKVVASEVFEVLNPVADKRNITMILDSDNVQVSGIHRYIYEIIYNLCDNAIRYNNDGGQVTVTIKEQDNNAIIKVADNGIGIPIEHQPRIFERFYRVDKSHSKETGGTGLGLSIVKHAVIIHSGKIELDSTVGVGTTITVILPINKTNKD